MPYTLPCSFFACLCLIFSIFHPQQVVAQTASASAYDLAISFDLTKNRLIGTARIIIPKEKALTFSLSQLTVTGALITIEDGAEKELHPQSDVLHFTGNPQQRTLYISYIRDIITEQSNSISPEGVSLTANWYPYPSVPYIFSVSARLPVNFSAITQSDSFPLKSQAGLTTSTWNTAARDIYFNAGPYVIDKLEVRDNFYVYSMFFEEDKELAPEYLEAAANYIRKFEKEIAPFPYNHYVIVANRLPTGYGMPTFTLLGQMVLRLPFIKSSSLGHEIVHSWFGNDVGVDYEGGNWCEALTTFLADHAFLEDVGKGALNRKESLIKYHSYVHGNDTTPFTLRDFKSASHYQPMADSKRAVGYNAGAFLFHELREYLGKAVFSEGIQHFYLKNRGTDGSWKDVQTSFEEVSGKGLETFFSARLEMHKAPAIKAENISVESRGGIRLNFTLTQQAKEVLPMLVPIQVTTMSGKHNFVQKLHSSVQQVSLTLPDRPLAFTLDATYSVLRQLSHEEKVPVWSRFLGAEQKLIVLENEAAREKYQAILQSLQKYQATVVTSENVTNKQLGENNLLFLGADQAPCRSIFGATNHTDSFTVDVRNNPLHPQYVAVIISDHLSDPSASIARKLKHYGKYSYLEFSAKGRLTKKTISDSNNGIRYQLERLPSGASTSTLNAFDKIIDELLSNRVIYIGETHTSLPDHLLQLRVIEALYKKDPRLAIGMEMFPESSQPSLDAYTGEGAVMDEKTFLKQSDYFNVWSYDYRLFRDILHFAKDKQLPVRALNLDRNIVSQVYRSGTTDTLTDDVKAKLPADRNLNLPGYQERLLVIHKAHTAGNLGQGSSSGFIQAQGLWDETMAVNIVRFLEKHPDHRMVVLAGSQHTRKDSGIPPRVASRMEVKQASLLNIYEDSFPDNLMETTDYYFLADNSRLPQTPKIGLVLSPTSADNTEKGLIIEELSPHGKAGEAGLNKGDILVRLDTTAITDMADLRIAMLDTRQGDVVEAEVLRGKDKKKSLVFKVELTTPQMPAGHP